MAFIPENADWVEGIYQIELEDWVEGGSEGVDNKPHIDLAKRTKYLKAHVDALENQNNDHIGSGGNAHALATEAAAGFMSAADKTRLNGLSDADDLTANGGLRRIGNNFSINPSEMKLWEPNIAHNIGDIRFSLTAASYEYMFCTVAGNSGAAEPAWPAVGSTVVDGTVTWQVRRIGNHIPHFRQIYSTAGTVTFTAPYSGLFKITVIGGGAGGGGVYCTMGAGGGGGGGGGAAVKWIWLNKGDAITVTVGAGGAGGALANGWSGLAGGTSSFGTYCSATGGVGGVGEGGPTASAVVYSGGGGGVGHDGDLNLAGGGGGDGTLTATAPSTPAIGGNGGGAGLLGGGTDGGTGGTPWNANSPGCGGPGASVYGAATQGGYGADGFVMIEG